ncbi:hypothetical protein [Thermoflavimicrobium daqui]|nr:hypothetical protein [Thermoflavimicrobium daqui]
MFSWIVRAGRFFKGKKAIVKAKYPKTTKWGSRGLWAWTGWDLRGMFK